MGLDISKERLFALAEIVEAEIQENFENVKKVENVVSRRVLEAFRTARVSEAHLQGTTGYGHSDIGRDALDRVVAEVMQAEDALVRHTMVSGTHALSVALFGVLRPKDVLLAVTGKPYDTLEETVGIRGSGKGSLIDLGVEYRQIDLLSDGTVDYDSIATGAKAARVVYVQKSRGYSLRPTLSVTQIAQIVEVAKKANPDAIVMVDNCYGELVEQCEPCYVGADLVAGSLIKNLGGGIARTGGYIAGKKEFVELCSYRLTAPGIGREIGCTLDVLRELFLGVFLAPRTVSEAVRTSIFASGMFSKLGFSVYPLPCEQRYDVIQSIVCKSREGMLSLCRGIQSYSPVDSFVTPQPAPMPGYSDEVIMAAGGFTQGASIELSIDGPIREPFALWLQGGLSYAISKNVILGAAESVLHDGVATLD